MLQFLFAQRDGDSYAMSQCSGCDRILEATQRITGCDCPLAGWCARHKMNKLPHFHVLCKTHIGYFEQYEEGYGPGQNAAKPNRVIGLGDAVAWMIRVLTLGLVKPCMGCESRMAWLNQKVPLWRRSAR